MTLTSNRTATCANCLLLQDCVTIHCVRSLSSRFRVLLLDQFAWPLTII